MCAFPKAASKLPKVGQNPLIRPLGLVLWVALSSTAFGACKSKREEKTETTPAASARTPTPEQLNEVLAKVGDRTITLGEYLAALDRMDAFERLRYQSLDRRKQLLSELVDTELLANEAVRLGLDKKPEADARLRQILRDELRHELLDKIPGAETLSESEVRAYYEAHKADFKEPERRRVAHIQLKSLALAKQVLAKAQGANGAEWGKLVEAHSLDKPPKSSVPVALELLGDLGIVGPPGHPRGANARVPEELRAAVFTLAKNGDIFSEPVAALGSFHIVRLTSISEARERSFADAERSIRVALVQEKIRQAEAAFEQELRKKYSVVVDEAALSQALAQPPNPPASGSKTQP